MPIDSITATGQLILNPFVQLANSFIEILPGLIVAIILIIVGWFVALGIGKLFSSIPSRSSRVLPTPPWLPWRLFLIQPRAVIFLSSAMRVVFV